MAITISGANNVDKILATDGVLDSISGFNVVGVMTAGTFDVTGKTSTGHLSVGSNIHVGNAGIITATTLVGNVTGNINHTSNLLLQISGSEKFRVGTSGQLGIGGANYGSAGQVLTSGGSGSAATWSTINLSAVTGATGDFSIADKIVHTGDTNTALRFPAADTFTIETSGSERLRIKSDGTVGINTTGNYGNIALSIYGADVGEGTAKGQLILKDNAAYDASPTAGIIFQGIHAAGSQAIFAGIRGFKENASNGNYAGALAFDVRAHGAVAYEALRISSDGHLGINTDFTGSQLWRAGKRLEIFGGSGNVTGELHLGANRGDGQQSVGSINFFDNTQDSNHRHIALIETDKSGTTSNKRGGAMVFYTKTDNVAAPTEKLRIHATGAVTQPYLPSFMAYGNSSWTDLNAGTNLQPYVFPNTAHNIGSHYNTSNGKFTAPVAGVYQFHWNIFCASPSNQTSAATIEFYVVKNGSTVSRLHNKKGYGNMGDDQQVVNLSVIEQLSSGDEISINAYAYTVQWRIYGGHTTFSGALIG